MIIAIALIFDFLNGVNDAANAVATVISTKVLTIPAAALVAACAMKLFLLIMGT